MSMINADENFEKLGLTLPLPHRLRPEFTSLV